MIQSPRVAGSSVVMPKNSKEYRGFLCNHTWIYKRVGHDERLLGFNHDGTIALGAADCERNWNLIDDRLFVYGIHGTSCVLECRADGRWEGEWSMFERMAIELFMELQPTDANNVSLIPKPRSDVAPRRLVYCINSKYFDMLRVSIASFLHHNRDNQWTIDVLDVGLLNGQRQILQRMNVDLAIYPAHHLINQVGLLYPATWARLKMLEDFASDDSLLLYLDADSLVLSNVEPMISEFVRSGKLIGLTTEVGHEGFVAPKMSNAFFQDVSHEFPNAHLWQQRGVMNTGVLLAKGNAVAELGRRCLNLYSRLAGLETWAEQTFVNAAICEDNYSWWEIPQHQHCMVSGSLIESSGTLFEGGAKYGGSEIIIRHFCRGREKEIYLRDILPLARRFFGV